MSGQKFIPESKENKIDYTLFDVKKLEVGPLVEKQFPPTAPTEGKYSVAAIQYIYDTANGPVKGALRLRGPRIRAPGGVRPSKNKQGEITGHGVTFRPLKGDPEHVKYMDVLHQIYVKCVQFLNTEASVEKVAALYKSFSPDLDVATLADPRRRWPGLDHILFYDKNPLKINPAANPIFSSPLKRDNKTMFLKPFKVCVTCGDKKKCDNPSHRKLPVPLDEITIKTAGFDGIPVLLIKDVFCGTNHKIRHELETLVVIDNESKDIATTEGDTIDGLEKSGAVDKDAYEERLRILGGQNTVVEDNSKEASSENKTEEKIKTPPPEEETNKGLPPADDIETV